MDVGRRLAATARERVGGVTAPGSLGMLTTIVAIMLALIGGALQSYNIRLSRP